MTSLASRPPLVGVLALLLACSSAETGNGSGGSGGSAGAGGSGGSGNSGGSSSGAGGTQGPPFAVGPKQYGTYLGFDTQGTHDCTVELSFVVYAPEGSGPYPIFVFTKGTRGEWDHDDLIHDEMLVRMATRGFVAASPDYQSNVEIYPGPYSLGCPGF